MNSCPSGLLPARAWRPCRTHGAFRAARFSNSPDDEEKRDIPAPPPQIGTVFRVISFGYTAGDKTVGRAGSYPRGLRRFSVSSAASCLFGGRAPAKHEQRRTGNQSVAAGGHPVG